jgi:hypothetical protein
VHVPAVEADAAFNGLLTETRVRGVSDKRWNVLSQSAAFVAKFAYGCTPKMAKWARLEGDGMGEGGWI